MAHTHKCERHCGGVVECNAGRVDNYDGWPEVLCAADADGTSFVCEECDTLVACDECGEWRAEADTRPDGGGDYCLPCYYVLDSVVAGLVAEAINDEGRDDNE